MVPSLHRRWLLLTVSLLALGSAGCGMGSGSADAKPDLYGARIKREIYRFRAIAEQRPVSAAEAELSDVSERIEGYEKVHLREHYETYVQILEKIGALKQQFAGGKKPSADAVKQAANELSALADKLPGEADKNPPLPSAATASRRSDEC